MEQAAQEAWVEAQRLSRAKRQAASFSKYQLDPAAFGAEILGNHFTEDTVRVMESVRDNPITIARSGNGVGKTFTAARIAVWFYKCFPDSQVYMTSAPPQENLRRLLWGETMSVVHRNPNLFAADRMRSLSIWANPRSFITGVAIPTSGTSEEREAKFSGKHAPHLLFIVDEGDAVPDEVYSGIESCMSGGHARLLIMFNPRASFGPVYQMEWNGRGNVVHLSAFRHPNVTQGKDIIPGAVDRETTVRRINEWTQPVMEGDKVEREGTLADDVFELPDFLENTTATALNGVQYAPLTKGLRKIIDPAFSYMVLGKYPAQGETQLINIAWLDSARSRWDVYVSQHGEVMPSDIEPIMAVDAAELGIDANVACFRYGGFVPRLRTWTGVDTDLTTTQALDLYRKFKPKICFIDATGVGSSIAPSMARQGRRENIRAVGVKVAGKPSFGAKTDYGEFYQLRDELWWNVREWLRLDPSAMLPPDPFLIEELKTPTYSVRENGKIKITGKDALRERLKRSCDRADALCLTFAPMARASILRLS